MLVYYRSFNFNSTIPIARTYIKGNGEVLVNVKPRISIRLQLKKSSAAGI